MSFLEDLLKKRLSGGTSHKGVEVEDLWAAIEGGLPAEENKPKPIPPWSIGPIGWLVLGVVLLLLAGGIWRHFPNEAPPAPQQAPIAAKASLASPPAASQQTSDLQKAEVAQPTVETSTTHEPDLRLPVLAAQGEIVDHTAGKHSENLPTGTSLTPERLGGRVPRPSIQNATENTPLVVAMPEAEQGKELVASWSNDLAKKENFVALAMTSITRLPIGPLERAEVLPQLTTNHPLAKDIDPAQQHRRPRLEAGLFVGTNWLRPRYATAGADGLGAALNATRGQALGQSVGMELSYRLNPTLRLIGGVTVARTHTTFRYTTTWDTVAVVNNTTVAAIATRRVTHNNFQTLISLPLLLEASKSFGHLEAGVGAGVALAFVSNQTGRFLNGEQEVVSFGDDQPTPLPVPNTYLAYVLRPQLTYRLNGQLSLQARADFSWQPYGTSALSGLKASGVQIGGSIGVLYGIKR